MVVKDKLQKREVIKMTNLEAIERRTSRRSYLNEPIEAAKRATIEKLILELNERGDVNMEFLEDGSEAFGSMAKTYGMFKNVRSLIVLKGKSDDPNLMEKLGYYGEELILEATKLDLGTCWVGGTFDSESKIFNLAENETLCAVIPIGNVNPDKGIKESAIYKMARTKTKPYTEMVESQETLPEWFIDAAKAVSKAPSARNTQKPVMSYKDGEVRMKIANDYRFDMMDLGIAKLHFVLSAGGSFEWGSDAMWVK